MKIPERTCGTQVILGELVHANQNMPAGKRAPPMIIGMSRSSGATWPSRSRMRAKRVLVM